MKYKRMILIILFTTLFGISLYAIIFYWGDLGDIINPNITEEEIIEFMEKYNLSCDEHGLFWGTEEKNSDMPGYHIKKFSNYK